MENNDFDFFDNRKYESDESFSSQDWDIIDQTDVKEVIDGKSYHNCNEESNDKDEDEIQNISKNVTIRRRHVTSMRQRVEEIDSKQLEDSDGVSVITDIETDLSVANYPNTLSTATTKKVTNFRQKNACLDKKLTLQVGVIMIIAIACSLGATIIIGTLCILNLYDGHVLKGNELENIDKVNSALLQLNENILATTKLYENALWERKKDEFHQFADCQKPHEIFGTSSPDPTMRNLEQLHTFYNKLCSIFTKLHEGNHTAKEEVCMSSNIIFDLINFKKKVITMLNEVKDTDKFLEKSFLYRTEGKISTVSQLLIVELSNTMQTLMTTISDKVYNEKNNVNEKLCEIQSEIISETEFSKTFGNVTMFLNSCTRSSNTNFSTPQPSVQVDDVDNKFNNDATKLLSKENVKEEIFKETDSCEIEKESNDSFESQIKRKKKLQNEDTDKKKKKNILEQENIEKCNKKYRPEKNNDNQKRCKFIHESTDHKKKIMNGEKENKNNGDKVKKVKQSENLNHGHFRKSSEHKKRISKKNRNDEINGSWQFERSHERDKFRNFGPELSYSNKNWFLQRGNSRFHARRKLDYGHKYNPSVE